MRKIQLWHTVLARCFRFIGSSTSTDQAPISCRGEGQTKIIMEDQEIHLAFKVSVELPVLLSSLEYSGEIKSGKKKTHLGAISKEMRIEINHQSECSYPQKACRMKEKQA